MAIGHIAIRCHSRSRGHTVAAALAYRGGEQIRCSRTGVLHDYRWRRAREEIEAAGITPGPWLTAEQLSQAMEEKERRKKSTLLRDVQGALPEELSAAGRVRVAREFSERLGTRFQTICAWAVHTPDPKGDSRNFHTHTVLPTRRIEDGQFTTKLRELDDRQTGPDAIREIRALWQEVVNAELQLEGCVARISTARNTGTVPQPTLGSQQTAIERDAWTARHNGKDPEGLSVAELVADGCVTEQGRRLRTHIERHGRHTEKRVAVAAETIEDKAAVAVAQRVRPVRRRRRRPARVVPEQVRDAPTVHRIEVSPLRPTPVAVPEQVRRAPAVHRIEVSPLRPTPVVVPERNLESEQVAPTTAEEEAARATVARVATADRLRLVGEQLLRRHAGERVLAPALPELSAAANETTIALVRTQTQRWQTRQPGRLPSALVRWRRWWAGHGARVVAGVVGTVWRVVWRESRAEEEERERSQLEDAAAWAAEQRDQLVSSITVQTTAAAGESLIREHGGEPVPGATSWFAERGLGPRASTAAVDNLLPIVMGYCVRDHNRRPGEIAKFRRWWRGHGAEHVAQIQTAVWPVHEDEMTGPVRETMPEVEVGPSTVRKSKQAPGTFER